MFKSIIYYNEKLIYQYGSLISESFKYDIEKVIEENDKGFGLSGGIGGVSANFKHNGKKGVQGNIRKNVNLTYSEFESALNNERGDSYFDFVDYDPKDEYQDLEYIGRNKIARVEGTFLIPEEFDIMHMIGENKNILMASFPMEDKDDEAIFKNMLSKENTLVPLKLELPFPEKNLKAFCKANIENFLIDFDAIDDYENDDMVFLFKTNGIKKVNNSNGKIVFDIIKDFFGISRAIRRQIKDGDQTLDGLEDIRMTEDYIEIELIAIYR